MPKVEILSYGEYSRWDRESRELPELVEMTEEIKARLDLEFGMLLEIRGAKGRYLSFRIEHPPFRDKSGAIVPPFEGNYQVKSSPFRFFLGDSLWEPLEDKKGQWTLNVSFDEAIVATKSLTII